MAPHFGHDVPLGCVHVPADVGIGMICPVQVTYSLMVGAILSYGIMWPLIENKQGDWFPVGKKYGEGGSNTAGLQGYKVRPVHRSMKPM